MKVQIEVPQETVEWLLTYAAIKGFKRENPRNRWTENEQKQAIRYALHVSLKAIAGVE